MDTETYFRAKRAEAKAEEALKRIEVLEKELKSKENKRVVYGGSIPPNYKSSVGQQMADIEAGKITQR